MNPSFLFGLHVLVLFTHAEQLEIKPLDSNNRTHGSSTEDLLQWPTRWKRTSAAVWGAPIPNYSNIVLTGPTIYLYTILFIDLKTAEHYNNDMDQVAREVVKLVRESNKYFYQLNMRVAVVDVLPTHKNDLTLYSFENFHNAYNPTLPYHNFAVLISHRYAGGLAFVSGFCSAKNVMMVGFYPHQPSAMASIFFHEVTHLIGVSHSHANESLDVPNCPCNSISYAPKSSGLHANQTGESLLSSTTRHVEGCLKIPGFDHNCTAQLAVNLLYRSRCLSNIHRTPAINRADGYFAEAKAKASLLSICGNGIVEGDEECDCGLADYCTELNCEALICERKIAIWILALGCTGLIFTLIVFLVLYARLRIVVHSKKDYSTVSAKMISGSATTHSDYTANISQMLNQLSRLFRSLKSMLCRRTQARRQEIANISSKPKLNTKSIVVVRSAQQLPANKVPAKRPQFPPPQVPRPKHAPPPRPEPPQIVKNYSHLEQEITYKFEDDFDD